MKVFVAGGTGFIGTALVARLLERGDTVTVLTRSQGRGPARPGSVFVQGDPREEGDWQGQVPVHDAVINLAGASIFGRWTRAAKERIRDSRIRTTRNLVAAMASGKPGPRVLVNSSAVGYYGPGDDRLLSEADGPGSGFLAQVCQEWEQEALAARRGGARVVLARFGVVLGPGGGALARMLPSFRWGLGAVLGSGRQWFPWIAAHDLVAALVFALDDPGVSGPVNCVAPEPVTNKEMTVTLARVMGRPLFLPPVPAWLLTLLLGEFASVFVQGQRVVPKTLLGHGFAFRFPRLTEALVGAGVGRGGAEDTGIDRTAAG